MSSSNNLVTSSSSSSSSNFDKTPYFPSNASVYFFFVLLLKSFPVMSSLFKFGHSLTTSNNLKASSLSSSIKLNPSLSKFLFLVYSKAVIIASFYPSFKQSDKLRFFKFSQFLIILVISSVASYLTKLSHKSNEVKFLQCLSNSTNKGWSPYFLKVFW